MPSLYDVEAEDETEDVESTEPLKDTHRMHSDDGQEEEPVSQSIVAEIGPNGRIFAARTVNGNRVEEFRPATEAELHHLEMKGEVLRAGKLAVTGQGAPIGETTPATTTTSTTPVKLTFFQTTTGLIVFGVGALIIGIYAKEIWQKALELLKGSGLSPVEPEPEGED